MTKGKDFNGRVDRGGGGGTGVKGAVGGDRGGGGRGAGSGGRVGGEWE